MKLGDMVNLMQPWTKMKISGFKHLDADGNRLWSKTLTEAQKYAYSDREILNHIIDENTMTVYCILRED